MLHINRDIDLAIATTNRNNLYLFHAAPASWLQHRGILAIDRDIETTLTVTSTQGIQAGMQISISGLVGSDELNGISAQVLKVIDLKQLRLVYDSTTATEYITGGVISFRTDDIILDENVSSIKSKITGAKQINDFAFMAIRRDWKAGNTYEAYKPHVSYQTNNDPYFAYVEDYRTIFICLQAGTGPSISKPVVSDYRQVRYNDGYIWQAIQTIEIADLADYYHSKYLPIHRKQQKPVDKGTIVSANVIEQGSGFTLADNLVVYGDGEGATAAIGQFGQNGEIVDVIITNGGHEYNWAVIYPEMPGTEVPVIEPVISAGIIGADPVALLRCSAVLYRARHDGSENERLTLGTERVYGIISMDAKDEIIDARNEMTIDGDASEFAIGETIVGNISGTSAIVTGIIPSKLLYSDVIGFRGFLEGELIQGENNQSASIKTNRPFDTYAIDNGTIVAASMYKKPQVRIEDQVDYYNILVDFTYTLNDMLPDGVRFIITRSNEDLEVAIAEIDE